MSPPIKSRLIVGVVLVLGVTGITGCSALPGSAGAIPTSTAAGFGDFSQEELATICIDATVSAFAEDVQFDPDRVRIEERTVDPRWLVLVPAQTSGFDGEAQCTIGGTPASPDVEISNASIEQLPEEQVQNLIAGQNEGGSR
jgi:hypothetical protein